MAPDIGEIITNDGKSYVVSGYLKRTIRRKLDRRLALRWCTRQQAQYVCGEGHAGLIIPTDEAVVTGHVQDPRPAGRGWSDDDIGHQRARAERCIGERY